MRTLISLVATVFAVPLLAQDVIVQPPPAPPPPPTTAPAPNGPQLHPGQPRVVIQHFGPGAMATMAFKTGQPDSAMLNRATLGLTLSATGSKRDTLGVFVMRVVPNGPAERAGVVEGDRIAAINGTDLRLNASDTDDMYAAGLPAHRLQREVQKVSAGTPVQLRVYSGGHYRTVTVTPGKMSDVYKGERDHAMLSLHTMPPMPDASEWRGGLP